MKASRIFLVSKLFVLSIILLTVFSCNKDENNNPLGPVSETLHPSTPSSVMPGEEISSSANFTKNDSLVISIHNSDSLLSSHKSGSFMKTSGVASKSGEQFSTSSSDDNAQVLWENLPDTMVAGSTTQVSIRMKNTGTATWTAAAGYKLGAVGDSDPLSAILRIQLPPDRSVLPGHSHIFNLVLRAPNQPGDYHTDWRMLQEGVRWFGEVAQKTVKVVAAERDDAKVIAMNFPSVMVAGSTHNVSITMRNTGTTTWSEADKYRLGAVGDSDPLSNRGRIVIPPPVRVEPGETHTCLLYTSPSPRDPE